MPPWAFMNPATVFSTASSSTGSLSPFCSFHRADCLNSTNKLSPPLMSSLVAAATAAVGLLSVRIACSSSMTCSTGRLLRLLRHLHPELATGVALGVGERGLGVVVGGELLELLLDPAPPLDRELDVLA